MAIMRKVAVFGAAGALGNTICPELDRRGIPFRVVGRNKSRLEDAFGKLRQAEIVPADLADARAATEAARGVDTVIYALGVPYTAFDQYPKLMRTAVDAVTAAGAEHLLVISGVYSYGIPQTQKVTETHTRVPVSRKGELRKQQEDIAMAANQRGQLKSMIVRLPDFYGPHADLSLANPVFRAALAGKTANWLGPVSTPHEFLFVPDAGPVIVDLASRDECYGEAWNFAGVGEITAQGFIQKIYQAVGREPKVRSAGRTLLRMMGWFNPLMRELPEMLYLQETPVLLDDEKLRRKLGQVHKTTYDEGIGLTLEWMRNG